MEATTECSRKVRLPLDLKKMKSIDLEEATSLENFMALNIYMFVPVSFSTLKEEGLLVEVEIRNETDDMVKPLEMKVTDRQAFFQPYTVWDIPRIEERGTASRRFRLRTGAGVSPQITKIPSELQFEYSHESWTAQLEVGHFCGQLCKDFQPPSGQEQYNIAIVGTPGSGKSMLINMIHTMLTAPCSRVSMIAPVGPFSMDTSEVHYEPYPLYKKFNIKATLWEATPFTETTIENPAFKEFLIKSEMPSSKTKETARRFDGVLVFLPESYLADHDDSPPTSITRYLRDLFEDCSCKPLLCISQTTQEKRPDAKKLMQKKIKLGANAYGTCQQLPFFSSKEKERELDVAAYKILDRTLRSASTNSYLK